jgi:cytoskeleton protein RodZ
VTERVGPTLRARREQLGWNLDDVAAWLRIRLSYLQALEAGRTTDIPGNAYAVGFLRTYAGALGFDAEDMVNRFKRETGGGIERKPELTFPSPVPDRGIPTGVLVLLGGVVVVAAYAGWYHYSDHVRTPVQQVPPVNEVMPGVTARSTTSPQIATVMPGPGHAPAPEPAAPAVAVPAITDAPSGVGSDQSAQSQPSQSQAPAAQSPTVPSQAVAPLAATAPGAAPMPQTSAAAPSVATPPADPNQIVLHASAATWVQVRGADGHVLYDHILQAGENWPTPAAGGPFMLTVGNAGGLTLSAGDATTQPLGRAGAVRRNIALSVEAIRDGSIVTAPPGVPVHARPAPAVPPGDQ